MLTKALGTGFVTTAAKAEQCPPDVLAATIASMTLLNRFGCHPWCTAHAHGMTDITGFGLAGHAAEMARASHVTVCLDVGRLPELPTAVELGKMGFRTRASTSNREFLAGSLREEPGVDADRAELAFDAQTSGGLLIAVPVEHATELLRQARAAGATAATIVGEVLPQQPNTDIVLRPDAPTDMTIPCHITAL